MPSISLLPMWSVSQYSVLFARVFHKIAGVRRIFKLKKCHKSTIILNNSREMGSRIQKYIPPNTSDSLS